MKYNDEYLRWLGSDALTADEKAELAGIQNDEDAKKIRFAAPMSFGTAGLRSSMYMGIGCMNRFTVAQATRGIATLVKKEKGENRGVAIAYDSRNNSRRFSEVAASVLAGAGIKVYIFDDLRPTPELSYAVRELHALAGINITASHNPKEYNGYKAYWEDGAQLGPEHADVVAETMTGFDVLDTSGMMNFEDGVKSGIITVLDEKFDEKYLTAVMSTSVDPTLIPSVADDLRVVYTPLHGAGRRLVPEAFRRAGLKHLYTVPEQMIPDGNFPTVKKPNPEYAEVFTLGIKIADDVGSDLIIATDPDSDRVGVMAREKTGDFETITGNQMGALLIDYIIKQKKATGTLPSGAFCVKSIVSTDMANRICDVQGVELHEVLTGFKFIGEVIKNYEARGEADRFLLGFEESYGYLTGTYARDKDAVGASLMILEMTAYYRKRGMTLIDALDELYKTYGYYRESTIDIYMEGLDGIARRKRVMDSLRISAPHRIGGVQIRKNGDFRTGKVTDLVTGDETSTGQPSSDVLYYTLENGDKIVVRPSGTEPKIKIYVLAHGDDMDTLEKKIAEYTADAKRMTDV